MSIFDNLPSFQSLFRGSPENPNTPLGNYPFFSDFFGSSLAGATVTPETAIQLPGVYSAVRLISETVASLPLQVFESTDTKQILKSHPIYRLIHDKPNKFMTSYQWRQLVMTDVLLWGNHYSLISERVSERPTQLTPFRPKDVKPLMQDGKLWYVFRTQEGEMVTDSSNVVHIKGLGFDGIKGKSVITIARENLGLGIAEQQTGANFYGKGMQLDYAIEGSGQLSEEGLKRLRATMNTYTGARGERNFLPLDAGMTIKPMGVPPQDAQFLESRKFSVTDIARLFRVPPPLLYDLERATFSNISELVLSFVKFSLTPWLVNFESELNDKLFFESEKETIYAEFNVDGLLRGDAKQRAESNKIAIQNGWMNPNEVRSRENMNGYDGGDTFYIPANMTPVTNQPLEKQNGKIARDIKELLKQ